MIRLKHKKNVLVGIMLVAAMIISLLGVQSLLAAQRVELDNTVKITAEVSDKDTSIFATKYKGEVEVNLYKLATLDETGKPTLTSEFAESGIDLSLLYKSPSVEEVETNIVTKATPVAKNLSPAKTIEIDRASQQTRASKEFEKGAGIYLYVPADAQDDRYKYTFTPYIIFAPTSDLIMFGQGSDEWKYESVFELKSSAEERKGSLEITKQLDKYSTTQGTASFGYEVIATLDEKTVFNNVYTIDFSAPGSKSILIENIPSTASVTVTEVYDGASYEPVGDRTKTATIVADNKVGVQFENTYDNRLITGGISTVNEFEEKTDGIYWKNPAGGEVKQTERVR